MANKNQRSVKYPGLTDTYVINQIAAEFDSSTSYDVGDYCNYLGQVYRFTAAHSGAWTGTDAEAVYIAEEMTALETSLDDYAKIDGYYDEMAVGSAEQLISTVLTEDKAPYNFRTSGGAADIGNRMTDMIVGGTMCWNQLLQNAKGDSTTDWTAIRSTISTDGDSITVTSDGTGTAAVQNPAGIAATVGHKYLTSVYAKSEDTEVRLYMSLSSSSINTNSVTSFLFSTANTWEHVERVTNASAAGSMAIRIAQTISQGVSFSVKKLNLIDLTQMFGTDIADHIYALEQTAEGAGVAWFRRLFPKDYYEYNAGELMSVQTSAHKTVGFNAYDPETGTAKLVGGQPYQITGTYTVLSLDGEAVTPDEDGYFTPANSGTLTVTGGSAADTCVHLVWSGYRDGEFEEYAEHVYPLDDSLTLRGVPKLGADGELYYDGDTYESDGTVTRRYGVRAYASGDESDTTVITDLTNTVYPLATPTAETAEPYQNPQIVDDFGTEEYVDAGTRDVEIPVGHVTQYQANLRDKLQHLPDLADSDGTYVVSQSGAQLALVPLVTPTELPAAPTTDGAYVLKATVTDGEASYTWEAAT